MPVKEYKKKKKFLGIPPLRCFLAALTDEVLASSFTLFDKLSLFSLFFSISIIKISNYPCTTLPIQFCGSGYENFLTQNSFLSIFGNYKKIKSTKKISFNWFTF